MTKLVNEVDAVENLWYSFFKVIALNFQELIDNSGALKPPVFNDSNRPDATRGILVIYNTDDGNLNISNGVNWILPDGTPT